MSIAQDNPTSNRSFGYNSPVTTSTRVTQLYLPILVVWLILRVGTTLWVMFLSPLQPLTVIEQSLPLWPATYTRAWMQRAWVAPWIRWDVKWYIRIIVEGYQKQNGTAQFHPLFPWLSGWLSSFGISADLSLLVISTISGAVFLVLFTRLASLDFEAEVARSSAWLLLFFPMTIILFAPYPEGLFLCLSALCLLWMREKKWGWAGAAGALAALTRQQGVFLILPLFWEWQRTEHAQKASWRHKLPSLAAMTLPAWGLAGWMIYRALALGDLHPDFSSLHNLVYSVIISPSANQVVTMQTFTWEAPWVALRQFWRAPDVDLGVNLALAAVFLIIFGLSWRFLHPAERLLCLAMFGAGFAYYTGPVHPYMGLPRHLFLAFPIFLPLGQIIRRPWQRLLFTGVGLLGGAFLLLLYILQSWVI